MLCVILRSFLGCFGTQSSASKHSFLIFFDLGVELDLGLDGTFAFAFAVIFGFFVVGVV
jgi:hypothetical protein